MRGGLIASLSLHTLTDSTLSLGCGLPPPCLMSLWPHLSVEASTPSLHSHLIPGLFQRQTVKQGTKQFLKDVSLCCLSIVHSWLIIGFLMLLFEGKKCVKVTFFKFRLTKKRRLFWKAERKHVRTKAWSAINQQLRMENTYKLYLKYI